MESALRTAMQDAFEREATAIRTAISETDWSETAVLDVVVFRPPIDEPATTADREIYRYATQAPPPSTYATEERSPDVRRFTRPLCERVGIDPETGTPREDGGQGKRQSTVSDTR